jgi:hypothetical protein
MRGSLSQLYVIPKLSQPDARDGADGHTKPQGQRGKWFDRATDSQNISIGQLGGWPAMAAGHRTWHGLTAMSGAAGAGFRVTSQSVSVTPRGPPAHGCRAHIVSLRPGPKVANTQWIVALMHHVGVGSYRPMVEHPRNPVSEPKPWAKRRPSVRASPPPLTNPNPTVRLHVRHGRAVFVDVRPEPSEAAFVVYLSSHTTILYHDYRRRGGSRS